MVTEPTLPSLTVEQLDQQEKDLIARRQQFIEQANAGVAQFDGALQHVQYQKMLIVRQYEEATAEADKNKKPRRAKVAKKAKETPVAGPATPEATPIGL